MAMPSRAAKKGLESGMLPGQAASQRESAIQPSAQRPYKEKVGVGKGLSCHLFERADIIIFAECRAFCLAHRVCDRGQQIVVGFVAVVDVAACFEVSTGATRSDKGDLVAGVRVSFAKFVAPKHKAIVENSACTFLAFVEFVDEVSVLFGIPLVDLDQGFDGGSVAIAFVRKGVVSCGDPEPREHDVADGG